MIELVERFAGRRLLVVGDCMLDCSVRGRVTRISPEAPVPVVESMTTHYAPGSAANVAMNLLQLGAEVQLVGVVGDDQEGALLRHLLAANTDVRGLLVAAQRPTTTKIRILAHGQQIVRVGRESRDEIEPALIEALCAHVANAILDAEVVVVSDDAKGVLVPQLVSELVQLARTHGVPVVIDPKDLARARYGGVTVVTPNEYEAAQLVGGALADPNDDAVLARAAVLLLQQLGCSAVLVTRGADGMTLFDTQGTVHIPADVQQAYDGTGAGDTVVALVALGIAVGAPLVDCARLASAAAGIVVQKLGTATVSIGELIGALGAEPVPTL